MKTSKVPIVTVCGFHAPSIIKWAHALAFIVAVSEIVVVSWLPVTRRLPRVLLSPDSGPFEDVTVRHLSDGLGVSWLIVIFLALASLDHFACFVLITWARSFTEKCLFVWKANPLRWFEYSASASIMMVLILSLCGVQDVMTVFMAVSCTAVCMLMGMLLEFVPPKSMFAVMQFALASFICLVPWAVAFCLFARAANLPAFVWVAMIGTFIAYFSFAVNMACERLVRLYPFYVAELIYIGLSLTSKTYLAFSVWGGFRANA